MFWVRKGYFTKSKNKSRYFLVTTAPYCLIFSRKPPQRLVEL